MKRLFVFVFALVMLSSTCFASMNAEYLTSMSIGGIQIGSSEEYVKSIYGEPKRIEYDRSLNGTNNQGSTAYTYIYGDTFKILFCGNNTIPMQAGEIISTANNGIKTEAGLSVGDNESRIIALYGTENMNTYHDKDGVIKYVYTIGKGFGTAFTVFVRHGKIIKIELSSSWNI